MIPLTPAALRLPEKRKPEDYVGLLVPNQKIGHHLSKKNVVRLTRIENSNRARARKMKALGVMVEAVDFIAALFRQDFLCHICQRPMDPRLKGPDPQAISLEHDPALSGGGHHIAKHVRGAHLECNLTKGATVDNARAAKIKRVQKAEARHAERMVAKSTGDPVTTKHSWPSRPMGQSRGFNKTLRKRMNGKVEKV